MPTGSVQRGFVTRPGEGVPGRGPDVKASGRSTGGGLTVMHVSVEGGPPKHTHACEDESLYVFTGGLLVECGEDELAAEPGSFVFLPRQLPHTFRALDGTATGLLIATPGGIDEYFAELHAASSAGAGADAFTRIRDAYGIARA